MKFEAMMYEEYLKKRIDSHGNGIITQLSNSDPLNVKYACAEIHYEIYDREVVHEIVFGREVPLIITDNSRANAIASAVEYGWELIQRGATCVIIDLMGLRFVCANELRTKPTVEDLAYALSALGERIQFTLEGTTKLVKIWAPELPFHSMELQYLPPQRHSSVNPYLGSMGKYLSAIFNSVIQLNQKSTGTVPTTRNDAMKGYTTLTHIEQLRDFTTYRSSAYFDLMLKYGFVDLVTARKRRLRAPPTLYFDITIAGRIYRLPLWCEEIPTQATIETVQRGLEALLNSIVVKIEVRSNLEPA